MSAIVTALDNHTPQQIGENAHVEFAWSNSIQEKILQFSFQITRTDEQGIEKLKEILKEILHFLSFQLKNSRIVESELAKNHLSILYKMIGQTRDIIDGKGEYNLTYMMILTWYDYFPNLALFALKCLVDLGDKTIHQYGSWKDIKYFCKFCYERGITLDHPLILSSVQLMNDQIKQDSENLNSGNLKELTLVGEWVPRESSKFGFLYTTLATNYFKNYVETAKTLESQKRATLKCKTEYRKLLASLNKSIDTLQIKQCANKWAEINTERVTSISFSKQKKALLNLKKNGLDRYPNNPDRIECAKHFKERIKKAVSGEKEIKGKRVGMADFSKQARKLFNGSQEEKDILNSQWRDNSTQNGALGNMIAMVDISGSMSGDPMDVAIALGIRIAEKSKLGKRVMTFTKNPRWVNLDPFPDFISQFLSVQGSEVGYNTDFYKALNLILDTIVENKMSAEEVGDMVLVMLSDMQIDEAEKESLSMVDYNNFPKTGKQNGTQKRQELYKTIKELYANAGMKVCGKPYNPPHILFWNLRSTSGFPSLSTETNVSMMSGFSPALLNLFCNKGIDALQTCTPWSILIESLENERYKIMSNYLESTL
jgi:uncharacterized protein with von Willebrand factor type A (vWA) domain